MISKLLLSLILISNGFKNSIADDDWSYKNPDDWQSKYPTCGGDKQSPINIDKNKMTSKGSLDINWKNYDNRPQSMNLANNGRTVELSAKFNDGEEIPSITSERFDGEYVFAHAKFHWGPNDESGSEHTIYGQSFPMECHLVHYKKDYGSFDEAIKKKDGLVVIVELYKPVDTGSNALHRITPHLKKIKKVGDSAVIQSYPLSKFYAVNSKHEWISYDGSMTIPNCAENAVWIIAFPAYKATRDQIKKFRSIKLTQGDDHNNRPVQPSNGRDVCHYTS